MQRIRIEEQRKTVYRVMLDGKVVAEVDRIERALKLAEDLAKAKKINPGGNAAPRS